MSDLTFTTIEESARHSLNISRDEYAACNYIQTWASFPSNSTPGFCNRTRGQIASFVGISERGAQKMLSRLEGMDLIKRASQSQFLYRITEKWFNTVVAAKQERVGEQSSRQGVNKVPGRGEQSSRQGVNKVHPHKELNNEVIRREGNMPAQAENFNNLEEEKNERGKVASPAESAAPTPTHMITDIRPESPHTRVVSPFVMPARVDTVDEAEEIIMAWATADGRESVRKWYADAARNCTANDVKEMVGKFAGVYLTIGDEGKRQRMAQDPLQFFKYTFKVFLQKQKQFDAPAQPTHQKPTYAQQPTQKSALPLSLQGKIGR